MVELMEAVVARQQGKLLSVDANCQYVTFVMDFSNKTQQTDEAVLSVLFLS
jgi:hypothetical protein